MQGKELSWHQVPCPRDPILLWIELYPVQEGGAASVQMWHYLGHVTWSQCGPSVGQCVHTDPGEWSHLPVSLLPHCPVTLSQLELWLTSRCHTATPGHTSSPHPAPAPPPASAPPPRPPLPRPPPRAELCRAPVSPGAAWEGLFREGVYIYSSVPRRAGISCAERQPRQLAINIQPPAAGTLSCTSYFYTGTSGHI